MAYVVIRPTMRVTRGEGSDYRIHNCITSEHTPRVSLAVSELDGELWGTVNMQSDRIYFFLDGSAHFRFENGSELDVTADDALFIPAGEAYKMSGTFRAVLVNSPAFSSDDEKEVEV